ncbi:MAG: LuxR C-terminal-related transcriptional regulator [Candidatus Promineifilaceae bacterium]
MNALRTLLIAPDPLARAALAMLLAQDDSCDVVGRSDGLGDWSELIDLYAPDVILCDIGWQSSLVLPGVRELGVPIVALVGDEDASQIVWRQGAVAVLGRDSSAEIITTTLQAAHLGLITFHPDYLPAMIGGYSSAEIPLPEPLTAREIDVLNLLAQGMTNRAIAHALQISDHTVKFHVNALLSKLNAQSRTEAAVKATRFGLLSI